MDKLGNGGVIMTKFKIGQVAEISKQITENDVQSFAEVSGDFNPVHIDEEYAKNTIFKGEDLEKIKEEQMENILMEPNECIKNNLLRDKGVGFLQMFESSWPLIKLQEVKYGNRNS